MDRFDLFATPIRGFPLDGVDALNRELSVRLLAESQATPGIRRSNAGGWHSVPDLSQRPEPCFRALMDVVTHHTHEAFVDVARGRGLEPARSYRYAVQAWAMVMRDGDYAIAHDHAEAHWSVVYYPDPGDAHPEHPWSGQLAFVDPGGARPVIPGVELFAGTFTVRPRAGLLVVFPGWLHHYVHPYRGSRPRISISCNLRMEVPLPPNTPAQDASGSDQPAMPARPAMSDGSQGHGPTPPPGPAVPRDPSES